MPTTDYPKRTERNVLDADGTVTYTELVPEITQEPDYDAAIAALS